MIKVENLNKAFKNNTVLKGIDLSVQHPGITAILGPNGSGKTTIIKSILGMVIPDEGKITVAGESIKGQYDFRKKVGYLPQIAQFPENLKVKELITLIQDIRGEQGHAEDLLEQFNLKPVLNHKLRNLSGGTKQKVNIVICLMFDPKYIILDEPTAGLDPISLITLKDLILEEKRKGKIIILTTHIMQLVEELADELVFLLEGKIFFKGTIEDMQEITGESNLERSIAKILVKKNKEIEAKLTKENSHVEGI